MSDIVRQQSPGIQQGNTNQYTPAELNADLANAELARKLVEKLPTPTIVSQKFTIIQGLMQSLNHRERTYEADGVTIKDPGNLTYIDTSLPSELMDRVSKQSVNVEGKYFNSLFALLMKPKYIIQGMPQAGTQEEEKPNIISRFFGAITGRNKTQEAQKQ